MMRQLKKGEPVRILRKGEPEALEVMSWVHQLWANQNQTVDFSRGSSRAHSSVIQSTARDALHRLGDMVNASKRAVSRRTNRQRNL
ncbi:MAG: hypothetical protein H6841_01890 [Planctomycetes bacterium]|nr:hypothetical protein [Planctomycetota bacterium]